MAKTVGVVMTDRLVAGLIVDHKVVGDLRRYPEHSATEKDSDHEPEENGGLVELPADALSELICDHIAALAPASSGVEAVGIAVPGIVGNGILEDSPNLPQLKGAHLRDTIKSGLVARGLGYNVSLLN